MAPSSPRAAPAAAVSSARPHGRTRRGPDIREPSNRPPPRRPAAHRRRPRQHCLCWAIAHHREAASAGCRRHAAAPACPGRAAPPRRWTGGWRFSYCAIKVDAML
eukprot:scaffold6454_cov113-Isochrysis_galbana.AAC.13